MEVKRHHDSSLEGKSTSSTLRISDSGSQYSSSFSSHNPIYNINVGDRLIADQGIVTPKMSARTLNRKVFDKSYYKALLFQSTGKIRREIIKLYKEIYLMREEYSALPAYRSRAESYAKEINELREKFSDYNLLDDMINMDMNLENSQSELKKLKAQNTLDIKTVETLFDERSEQDALLKEMKAKISEENHLSDILAMTISPEMCEKIKEMKEIEDYLNLQLQKLEQEISRLNLEKSNLECQVASTTQLKAFELCCKLRDLENIRKEKTEIFSLNEEDAKKRKINDKKLLSSIYRQTQAVKEYISKLRNKCNEIKQNAEFHCDNVDKCRKLESKEKLLDEYISFCDESQRSFFSQREQLQTHILSLLKNLSGVENVIRPGMESGDKCFVNENNVAAESKLLLVIKEEFELLRKIYMELEEAELQKELESVKAEIAVKSEALAFYSDLENLKAAAKKKEEELQNEARKLQKQKQCMNLIVDELMEKYTNINQKLNDNPVFMKLHHLENKLQILEKENFALQEFIASKKKESDYLPVKETVKTVLAEINEML